MRPDHTTRALKWPRVAPRGMPPSWSRHLVNSTMLRRIPHSEPDSELISVHPHSDSSATDQVWKHCSHVTGHASVAALRRRNNPSCLVFKPARAAHATPRIVRACTCIVHNLACLSRLSGQEKRPQVHTGPFRFTVFVVRALFPALILAPLIPVIART